MKRLLATVLAASLMATLMANPANAIGSVNVTGPDGTARVDLANPTTLQLSGSGFQSIQGGFGGVYVLFGWVANPESSSWRPSQGGVGGSNFRYIPDTQDKVNQGYEKFVAFPGSDTANTANGGLITADGTWSTTLTVPGPTFQSLDANGATVTTDCRLVQCGVITIGAHGVVNPTNETFTPVSFADLTTTPTATSKPKATATSSAKKTKSKTSQAEAGPSQPNSAAIVTPPAITTPDADPNLFSPGPASGGPSPASVGPAPASVSSAAPTPPASLGVDQTTAVAGHALSFTAQGLIPGEQVVVVLDDGLLAQGPLLAGDFGELAGVLQLPDDLRLGTHVLRLTGAASKQQPELEIVIRRDGADVAAATQLLPTAADQVTPGWQTAAVSLGLLVVLAVGLAGLSTALLRRRRAASQAWTDAVVATEPVPTPQPVPTARPPETTRPVPTARPPETTRPVSTARPVPTDRPGAAAGSPDLATRPPAVGGRP